MQRASRPWNTIIKEEGIFCLSVYLGEITFLHKYFQTEKSPLSYTDGRDEEYSSQRSVVANPSRERERESERSVQSPITCRHANQLIVQHGRRIPSEEQKGGQNTGITRKGTVQYSGDTFSYKRSKNIKNTNRFLALQFCPALSFNLSNKLVKP